MCKWVLKHVPCFIDWKTWGHLHLGPFPPSTSFLPQYLTDKLVVNVDIWWGTRRMSRNCLGKGYWNLAFNFKDIIHFSLKYCFFQFEWILEKQNSLNMSMFRYYISQTLLVFVHVFFFFYKYLLDYGFIWRALICFMEQADVERCLNQWLWTGGSL